MQEAVTYLVTTKDLTQLLPGKSTVAFYGDADLDNTYLGRGVFQGYLPLTASPGWEILSGHALYTRRGYPDTARGLVALSKVVVAGRGESLEVLDGTIIPSGLPLLVRNIPQGQARGRVYFLTKRPLGESRGAVDAELVE